MTHAPRRPYSRGTLGRATAAGLLRLIHAGRRSGVLHLTRDETSKRLYFKDGSIVLAGSDLPEDRLGRALVRAGMVSEADLERALGAAEASNRPIGEVLVELGLLQREPVQAEAARRTRQIVDSVLDWDSGEYAFEEREERLEGELLSELAVPQVLLEWARRAPRPELARQLLDDGRAVLRRSAEPGAVAPLRLAPSEEWVLAQADGASSAAEIAARCPMGESEALRASTGLYLAGAVEAGPPQATGDLTRAYPSPAAGPSAGATQPPGAGTQTQPPGSGTQLWAALEAEQRADLGDFGNRSTGLSARLPETLGRYLVERAIGRGSMGAVLLARDPAIDRQVAVKLIQTSVQLTPPEWEKYKERFYREARAAGKLLHQGIVAIFDVGHTVEGIPFIVMEYVEGRTLAALAEDQPLSQEEVLRLAGLCLEALEYAHAQGVVHRDLKPANIMIAADGRPKIMDFGVAHVVGSQMTQADEILGSPYFMAPEQLGKGKVDQRTDLFAFGVVLYWMLTGQLPFTGDSFAAIAQAVLSERPVSPKELKRNVPRALGTIVLRCLEKNPARRYANAGEVRAALRALERPRTRPLRAVAALAVVLAALAASLYVLRTPATTPDGGASSRDSGAPARETAAQRGGVQSPRAPSADATAAHGDAPAPSEQAGAPAGSSAPPVAAAAPDAAASSAREEPARSPEQDEAARWRKSLPLTFPARHNHRLGGCNGTLRLDAGGIEFRSDEHGRWRWRFAEIRVLEREDPRKLRLETEEREVLVLGRKDYKFELDKPLGDADWARYRKLAGK